MRLPLAWKRKEKKREEKKREEKKRKERKRKDYAFRRQFNEKPSLIPGCPGPLAWTTGVSTSPGPNKDYFCSQVKQ